MSSAVASDEDGNDGTRTHPLPHGQAHARRSSRCSLRAGPTSTVWDLTGFIDGSENPTLIEAPGSSSSRREAGAGGTVLLLQEWVHDADAWRFQSPTRSE
jgi:deferrochelatase/peroxidase EfeB